MQIYAIVPLLLLHFTFVCRAQLTARAQADEITSLPDITFKYSSRMFGGYLKPDSTKLMYYWYLESQRSPSDDPLLLWLEGGPGCSSVGSLFQYNGPFHSNVDQKTLFENVFSWNKFANVLYIESPAPVGFSHYVNFDKTIPSSDDSTAVDNYNALIDFFNNIFPNLKPKNFFISGHSYAGAYLPLLTIQIIKGMQTKQFETNFRGMLIGNGVMSEKRQHNTLVPYMYYHGLIGSRAEQIVDTSYDVSGTCMKNFTTIVNCSMWNKLKASCCPTTCMTECDFWSHMVIENGTSNYDSDNTLCGNLTWITTEWDQWGDRKINDMYDIYQDCYRFTSEKRHRAQGLNLIDKSSFTDGANQNYDSTDAHNGFDCWGGEMTYSYLNRPDVQAALHVNTTYKWESCSDDLIFNRSVYELDSYFDYILQNSDISILIYAGDVDLVCNFMMQELFVNDVAMKNNLTMHGDRTPWIFRGRIAGYQRIFDRIHHLTVKGSGHLVPQERPGPALQMIANFLFNHAAGNYSIPSPVSTAPQPLLPQYQPQPAVCATTTATTAPPSSTKTNTLTSTTAPSNITTAPSRQGSNRASVVGIAVLLLVAYIWIHAI